MSVRVKETGDKKGSIRTKSRMVQKARLEWIERVPRHPVIYPVELDTLVLSVVQRNGRRITRHRLLLATSSPREERAKEDTEENGSLGGPSHGNQRRVGVALDVLSEVIKTMLCIFASRQILCSGCMQRTISIERTCMSLESKRIPVHHPWVVVVEIQVMV
jgi:hypothetical protein